jgi:hypothetical protein
MDGRVFPTNTVNIAQDRDFYKIERITLDDIAYIRALAGNRAHPTIRDLQDEFLAKINAPIELFYRSNLNANEKARQELDLYMTNVLEDFHAGIESNFMPLLRRILSGDIAFYPNDPSCVKLFIFLSVQYMRTKAIRERVLATSAEKKLPDLSRIWNFLSYLYAMNIGLSLFLERSKRQLVLLRNNTGVSFVTGDQPMTNLLATGGVAPEALSIYYPVSPTLALVLSEEDKESLFTTERLTISQVGELNARIASVSHRQIFGHSKDALLALKGVVEN